MKQDNIILDKTFALSLRVIKLYNHLRNQKIERDLCLQLLRSGTSIGANTEEAIGGSSRKDFVHKLEIAYREARETKYWVHLFKESELLEMKLVDSFLSDIDEKLKILIAFIKSSKSITNS